MAEFQKPQSRQEFDQNFAQIHPVMNDTEALYESSRCLFCYDAPCINACPTAIDIPLFIRQINTGNVDGAAQTIYDANYFGLSCGKVCPTEVLCEGACVYNHQDVKPIEIGRLQSYAAESVIRKEKHLYQAGAATGKKVAVIGAGPAGITCACELRRLGHSVDVFEGKSRPSGLNAHGVAPYKITDEEALGEVAYLQNQFGFDIRYNEWVDSARAVQLENEYDAIFLGIGLGETTTVDVPGTDLENCIGAVEFIENLRTSRHEVHVGQDVIVIGGGNTAMDAASESARMGAQSVVLAYRRGKNSMRAYEFEFDLAKSVGAYGLFNAQPVEILGDGRVEGVRFLRTANENGTLKEIAGSEFVLGCDQVILATGQSKQVGFLQSLPEVEVDKGGRIVVNDTYQTTNPKYFAAGDAVNGGKEVVNAVADGKVAAAGIHSFLTAG